MVVIPGEGLSGPKPGVELEAHRVSVSTMDTTVPTARGKAAVLPPIAELRHVLIVV